MSSEATESSSEAKELRCEVTDLSSEATEFNPGRFARRFVGSVRAKNVFQRKSMVLGAPNAKIVRNVEDLGQPREHPCTQSVRFPKEKHGFGHSKCKNSEKRRGFGTAKGGTGHFWTSG